MKRLYVLSALLCLVTTVAFTQTKNGITFKVEELTPPKALLPVKPYQTIVEDLIRREKYKLTEDGLSRPELQKSIVAKSEITQPLVNYRMNSFFDGMYSAYSDHRPFTLSPDMIWIVISQGFAQHVNNNAEDLRKLFVDFDGKTSLVVQNDKIKLDDPSSPWNEVFDSFSNQISSHVGKELTGAMTADFSTTTTTTRIASQITLMNALKSYFEFVLMISGCGIPEVTLEGTTQDWQRLLQKTEALRKYQLDWWVDEMEPVLKQFVKASAGKVNKSFWRAMFKIHKATRCGEPTVIDGWVVKFYPYNREGKRNSLKQLRLGFNTLPDEIVKVDLNCITTDAIGNAVNTPLELWAGFVGLEQDENTFGLKPKIGWLIRKKDDASLLVNKLKTENARQYGGIDLRIKTVPPELYTIGPINKLMLSFIDQINIPDELAAVPINQLTLSGTITPEQQQRIVKLFPKTNLRINGEQILPAK